MCRRFASSWRTSWYTQKKRQAHLRQDWVFLTHMMRKALSNFLTTSCRKVFGWIWILFPRSSQDHGAWRWWQGVVKNHLCKIRLGLVLGEEFTVTHQVPKSVVRISACSFPSRFGTCFRSGARDGWAGLSRCLSLETRHGTRSSSRSQKVSCLGVSFSNNHLGRLLIRSALSLIKLLFKSSSTFLRFASFLRAEQNVSTDAPWYPSSTFFLGPPRACRELVSPRYIISSVSQDARSDWPQHMQTSSSKRRKRESFYKVTCEQWSKPRLVGL